MRGRMFRYDSFNHNKTLIILSCLALLGLVVAQSAAAEVSCVLEPGAILSSVDLQSRDASGDILDRLLKFFRYFVQLFIDLQCKIYRIFGFRCG